MKSQSNYYSNQKISNCATPSQQPFRRKYYHSNKKPKRVYSSSTQPLPQNHQANIICFQHCAVWSLKLSTITNSNKKCISQRSIEGKIAQVNQNIKSNCDNVIEYFPIDIRKNQRFALDRNQPKIPLNIEFDCVDMDESFEDINKEYASYIFEIDLNAKLHSCAQIFKDNINFKVKGYDIIKSIQSRLNNIGQKERNGYLNMKAENILTFSANVFNNIQCSFGVVFTISTEAIDDFFSSSYHNVYLMSEYGIKVTKLKIIYNLPLIVFSSQSTIVPNAKSNQLFFTQPIQFYLNFCNWHSFMSCTTPIIFESEDLSIKNILYGFKRAALFGIGAVFRLDGNFYTKVNYYPTINSMYINLKEDNTNTASTNNNPNDSSTLDGSFRTSISSSQQDEKTIMNCINCFNTKKIVFKEQVKENYNVKSFMEQVKYIEKTNSEIDELTLNDIYTDSYFSIVWTPLKTAQPKDLKGMKFVESGNCSSFEIFYRFRGNKLSNTAHYMNVIGIAEKDIKGRNINSLNYPMFDYFWFANRSANANQFLMNKDLYFNKNYFYSFKEFVSANELNLP